jgi:hypothetical protein
VHLTDKLDFTGIDATTLVAGDQAFRWVGSAAFTGAPGEVCYVKGATTMVRATTDGDVAPELEIRLTGNKILTKDDARLLRRSSSQQAAEALSRPGGGMIGSSGRPDSSWVRTATIAASQRVTPI